MGARTDTRQRMIDAAKQGFRSKGVGSTSFSDVLDRAGAARGAIYHHFPGGRRELTVAVVASTAANVTDALLLMRKDASNSHDALTAAVALLCDIVDRHAGAFGCPITPAVLEASGDTEVLAAGHAAFERWQAALVEHYHLDADRAALWVASVEGALVMCRASGSSEPLRRVIRALSAAFDPAGEGQSGD